MHIDVLQTKRVPQPNMYIKLTYKPIVRLELEHASESTHELQSKQDVAANFLQWTTSICQRTVPKVWSASTLKAFRCMTGAPPAALVLIFTVAELAAICPLQCKSRSRRSKFGFWASHTERPLHMPNLMISFAFFKRMQLNFAKDRRDFRWCHPTARLPPCTTVALHTPRANSRLRNQHKSPTRIRVQNISIWHLHRLPSRRL